MPAAVAGLGRPVEGFVPDRFPQQEHTDAGSGTRGAQFIVRARAKLFEVPPIRDALVIGTDSPIGCEALKRALNLLVGSPFEHLEVDDEVVRDILVRKPILRRLPEDRFVAFILDRIKPLMDSHEILRLDLETDVLVESEL